MNIAQALKSEISRVARREVRADTQSLKTTSTKHRSEIAALKRQIAELERRVSRLSKGQGKKAEKPSSDEATTKVRFSAKGFASLRKKLGLSAGEMGQLIGVSDQSVYKYEKGEVQPRQATLAAIAGLRGLGKKAVAERLAKTD